MRSLLAPISFIVSAVTSIRNWMFDDGIIKSWHVDVPTICVGNMSVGGAGKTPHVEYIVRMLSPRFKVGVLSRGYKRRSSGFILADENSTVDDLGDEPMQMHEHFPDVPIAVCEHRVRGINQLCRMVPDLQVVVLDDGFQHRRLKAGFYVLLTPHDRLYVNDHVMPWGSLREPISGAMRAQAVVVTKCPPNMQPIDKRVITSALKILPFQQLYFSSFSYGKPYRVFTPENDEANVMGTIRPIVVTGIVHPEYLTAELDNMQIEYQLLAFADHHRFTRGDINKITNAYKEHYANCILTTEKDAERLRNCPYLTDEIKHVLYAMPIEVDMQNQTELFQKQIIDYVTENNRNR